MVMSSNNPGKILVVDDENSIREIMSMVLEDAEYFVRTAKNGFEALDILKSDNYDLLITDIRMPKMDGIELFRKVKKLDKHIEVIVISAYADVNKAVKSIKMGAFDYLQKDFTLDELLKVVRKALKRKNILEENYHIEQDLKTNYSSDVKIIYQSKQIKKLCEIIEQIAPTKASVLITGESGVGKEVFANALHKKSTRSKQPFVPINCGALPDNLLESELFGYEKGAFTGAVRQKMGLLERANRGTIFLDEIGDISSLMQVKILRFLEEEEIKRLGGLNNIKLDVRVVSATNKNLEEEIKSGKFREDLFYRLNVINLHIPPLRKRREDIPLLAKHFLNYYSKEYKKNMHIISTDVIGILLAYDWPGNVRELKNVIERAVAIADLQDAIMQPRHLPKTLTGHCPTSLGKNSKILSMEEFEKIHIINTLEVVDWNKSLAAQKLGINRQTLYNKIKRYNIRPKEKVEN